MYSAAQPQSVPIRSISSRVYLKIMWSWGFFGFFSGWLISRKVAKNRPRGPRQVATAQAEPDHRRREVSEERLGDCEIGLAVEMLELEARMFDLARPGRGLPTFGL